MAATAEYYLGASLRSGGGGLLSLNFSFGNNLKLQVSYENESRTKNARYHLPEFHYCQCFTPFISSLISSSPPLPSPPPTLPLPFPFPSPSTPMGMCNFSPHCWRPSCRHGSPSPFKTELFSYTTSVRLSTQLQYPYLSCRLNSHFASWQDDALSLSRLLFLVQDHLGVRSCTYLPASSFLSSGAFPQSSSFMSLTFLKTAVLFFK